MKLVDFTKLPKKNKAYTGANGSKICVVYEGEQYMLKFPPIAKRNKNMSYSNSCFSEYLGCKIFESVGIPTQTTMLGTYHVNGNDKIVVACGDFTRPGIVIQDFASLKNQIVDSVRNGYGTELEDILSTFHKQTAIDATSITERFWDMFVTDAFIGNWDRHNGNWGFLYDAQYDTMELAPVYDCGSSLYPQADDNLMSAILSDEKEMQFRIYEIPLSAIYSNGKKIKYFDFLVSLDNEDCNRALARIVPRIDMKKIDAIIEEMPFASALQKQFYRTMLQARKEMILDKAHERLVQKQPLETQASKTSRFQPQPRKHKDHER